MNLQPRIDEIGNELKRVGGATAVEVKLVDNKGTIVVDLGEVTRERVRSVILTALQDTIDVLQHEQMMADSHDSRREQQCRG